VILDVFSKKTATSPRSVIANCRRRLKQYKDVRDAKVHHEV
jgi:phage-related protein